MTIRHKKINFPIKESFEIHENKSGPFLRLSSNGELPVKLPEYAYKILEKDFGHKSFRKYQEEAIIRISCGLSTLVILSTGNIFLRFFKNIFLINIKNII